METKTPDQNNEKLIPTRNNEANDFARVAGLPFPHPKKKYHNHDQSIVMCRDTQACQSPAFGNPPSTDRLHDNTQQALENALIQERERNKDN